MKNIRDLSLSVKRLGYTKRLQLITVLLISLFASNSAFALKCANADNGSATSTDPINSVAVPQSAVAGNIIWRSENRTMRVQCWKDHGAENASHAAAEIVYAYMNPQRSTIGSGVSIGVVINGRAAMDIATNRYALSYVTVPYCNQIESICKATASVTFTLSYYVYIEVKKPTPSSGNYTGANSLAVFQLDGVGGLNPTVGYNFNYMLSGLTNIRFIQCEADVSVSPNSIDFGAVVAPTATTNLGLPVKSSNFKATVSKSCDSPFKLTAIYSSPASKVDGSTLNLNNGLGLKVKNLNTNSYVQYGEVSDFVDMTSNMSAEVPFLAELSWLNRNPTVGEFNTSLTIDVYYN